MSLPWQVGDKAYWGKHKIGEIVNIDERWTYVEETNNYYFDGWDIEIQFFGAHNRLNLRWGPKKEEG